MRESLSGEPGQGVLAAVEQQLGAGARHVMTLLQKSPVLADITRPWLADLLVVSVKILVRYFLQT